MTIALIIFAIFVIGNIARLVYQNAIVPELGVTDGQLAPVSKKPNNVSTQTNQANKLVEPLPAKATLEQTMATIKKAVQAYGGATFEHETSNYLYVVFTTPTFKFHDDAEFWIDMEAHQVHFRSSSRAGVGDLGLNRKRYEVLTKLYNN